MIEVTECFEVTIHLNLLVILAMQHVFLTNHVKDEINTCRTFVAGLVKEEPEFIGLKCVFYDIPFHGYLLLT